MSRHNTINIAAPDLVRHPHPAHRAHPKTPHCALESAVTFRDDDNDYDDSDGGSWVTNEEGWRARAMQDHVQDRVS